MAPTIGTPLPASVIVPVRLPPCVSAKSMPVTVPAAGTTTPAPVLMAQESDGHATSG